MYSQNRSTNVSSKSSDSFWTNFFTKNGKDILLYCKSHSSPYPTITKKVIIGLIEQLCLYQMTDHSIKNTLVLMPLKKNLTQQLQWKAMRSTTGICCRFLSILDTQDRQGSNCVMPFNYEQQKQVYQSMVKQILSSIMSWCVKPSA